MAVTLVTRTQGNNKALKDGTVKPRTCEFEFVEVDPLIDAFRRMVRGLEFDVSELALTTYITARAHGKRFTALPIFLVRAFHHGAIVYNTKSGIKSPKDLEGRKVGVNRGYTVTTGVWARGVLRHQYGVDLDTITWVLSGNEHVEEFRTPFNVVPIEKGKKMADLVASGELPAAIGLEIDSPDVKPLIPNAAEAGLEALRSRGHYPINHLIVVKDELLDAHPRHLPPVRRGQARLHPAPPERSDPEPDPRRRSAPARHGDHRPRPPALRHRTQPAGDRGAHPVRPGAADHRPARDRGRVVSAQHARARGVMAADGASVPQRKRDTLVEEH